MREEAVYESDLIREKQAEAQAQHAGNRPQVTLKEVETRGVCDRDGDRRGH